MDLMFMNMKTCVEAQRYALGAMAENSNPSKTIPIALDGRTVGAAWDDGVGRWFQLAGILPSNDGESRNAQTVSVLDQMEDLLDKAGLDFTDVFRTWFVLDGILDCYNDFNRVRNEFFKNCGVCRDFLPASTAVGASNPWQTHVVAGLLAVRPHDDRLRVAAAESPLQGAADDYGSAFNRAMKLRWPGGERLFVSGTASISQEGESLHVGKPEAQIEHTLDVVGQLLSANGFGWDDVLRGVAYFRRVQDSRLFSRLHKRGLRAPIVATQADICRDDLLFELELEAGKGKCSYR